MNQPTTHDVKPAVLGPPRTSRSPWLAGLLSLLCLPAWAQSPPQGSDAPNPAQAAQEPWKLTGFGTLGLQHSHSALPWLFARDLTQKGATGPTSAAIDSRFGIQLQGNLSRELEAVAQVVVRDRPAGSPADASLEWAFLGWHLTPQLKLRLGRTSPDLFLLADVRNVGFAYPWVRPSVEYYGWMPFSSMDGADITLQWRTDTADWKGKVAFGQIRSTIGVINRSTHSRVEGNDTLAATLSRESGGLLLKASYLRARMSGESPAAMAPLTQGLSALMALPVPSIAADAKNLTEAMQFGGLTQYGALGAQYDQGNWTVHAEASRVRFTRGVSGGDRGYISLGYRWSRVTGFVVGARSRPDMPVVKLGSDWATTLAPVIGPAAAQQTALLGAHRNFKRSGL